MDAQSAPKIGKLIKRARERKRLSQAEAAKALGISRSALNAWENDRAYPRSSIGAMEAFYGIAIDSEPEPEEPEEMPTPEELADLRVHIREVLGDKASVLEAALDAAISGKPRSEQNAGGGGASSGRRAG